MVWISNARGAEQVAGILIVVLLILLAHPQIPALITS
jgi:hypothetical protein